MLASPRTRLVTDCHVLLDTTWRVAIPLVGRSHGFAEGHSRYMAKLANTYLLVCDRTYWERRRGCAYAYAYAYAYA